MLDTDTPAGREAAFLQSALDARMTERGMTAKLSDDPRDKLQAALHHAAPDPDDDLDIEYRDACAGWFAQLTETERWVVLTVTVIYEQGDEDKAEGLASQLPPAPIFLRP